MSVINAKLLCRRRLAARRRLSQIKAQDLTWGYIYFGHDRDIKLIRLVYVQCLREKCQSEAQLTIALDSITQSEARNLKIIALRQAIHIRD